MRFSLLHIVIIKTAAIALGFGGLSWGWTFAFFFGADVWVLYHLFVPGASGLVRTFKRFETDRPEVWLTIDDGPDEHDTPKLLDLMDQHGARATFFLIGERAARHPELVAEIARRGHEIGHHTHTHPAGTFWCATPAQVKRQLDDALPHLTPPGGAPPRRFRPPVGIKNLFLARALTDRALACVSWNVRSRDSFARTPENVSVRVLKLARPGSILLLHEGASLHSRVRVTAIAQVLAGLDARGLRCVIPSDEQLR